MNYKYVATCLFGLEKLVGEQIDALGGKRLETIDGRIIFEGDETLLARASVNFRYAERIFILVGDFHASSFTELFDGTAALPWEAFIGENDAFPVSGHAIKSTLFSIPDCQSIVKKAVVKRLSEKYHRAWFDESGAMYKLEFFLLKDRAMLMIDTTGTALHKRGYRPHAGEAPLRETLAAAVAAIARPREDVLLWDPLCGSGTIVIEAAMLMTGRAPGVNRNFAAEAFAAFPEKHWKLAREEAADMVKRGSAFEAWGSDIDASVLEIAKESARRAGVGDRLSFFTADAAKLERPDRRGTLVCNPPYGERLMTLTEAEALYKRLGEAFRAAAPWQVYVLTPCENFERLYGKRADKIKKLYNGMIPCRLYQFFKNERTSRDR